MILWSRVAAGGVCFALALVACGDAGALPPTVIVVNSPGTLVTGESRLLLALLDQDGSAIGGPDVAATVDLISPETGQMVASAAAEFVWTVPNVRGLYTVHLDIPLTGVWGLTVRVDGMDPSEPAGVQVGDTSVVPIIGDRAPASVTPTSANNDLAAISTDTTPNPRFYEHSLASVLGTGVPVVVVFATPALCTSAACGPMLDVVDDVSARFDEVEFVHVEVYTNLQADNADELELAPAVIEWGLPSEPWVFVMNGEGMVVDSFEGSVSEEELTAAIDDSR